MTQFLSRHACICAFNYACGENWQAAGCVKARMHKRVPRGIGSGKPSQGAAAGACVCILSCWVRGEAGAVCVCVFSVFICSHAAPNYPTNPGRSESRHAGDSRDALIWHVVSHALTHTFTVRGMRGFLSAVSHRHLQLHLYPPPPFSILIRIQKCFVKVRLYLNNCPIGMFSIAKISATHILNSYIALIAKSILWWLWDYRLF